MDYCLIHLSDFHLRSSTQLQTNDVLKSLTGDLKKRIQELGLPDPHIALSGDLAFGGREEEYSLVDGFVDELRESVNARKMVYCGGNHDVNWSLLAPFDAELMNDTVEKRGGVAAAEGRFSNQADREALRMGMGPYYSFLEKRGLKSTSDLFYVDSVDVADIRLNYISLNSAFLFSMKHFYHGYVGLRQMMAAESAVASTNRPSFNITLVHHPLEAIVPAAQEETKRRLFAFSDIILNGHVHSPRVSVEYTATMLGRSRSGPPPVISCARCVFDEANDPSVTSGYSIMGLDFQYEKVISIKVWEVQFDKTKKEWYADESKGTYPMTVSVPTGKEGSLASDQVGHKVTDAERALLGKWKRTRQG